MKRAAMLAIALALVGLTATACGSSKKSSSGGSTSVTISNEQGTTWTCGFSPFNADVNFLSVGTVYETLTFVNGLQSGKTTNWLASNYAWSNGNKTLTVTIGSRIAGAQNPAVSESWTFNPTATATKLLSATGSFHACDTNAGGGNCLPALSGGF